MLESSDFYRLMSRFSRASSSMPTAGTGMNPGLKELIKADTLENTSGEFVLEIFDAQGNRRPDEDLDADIIPII